MSQPQRPTKIAFVSNTSWSIFNFRIEIIRSLHDLGIEVYVLAPKDNYSAKIVSVGVRFIPISLNNYSVNPLSDLKLLWQLNRLYREHRFDHVFHYTIKPNIYGSMAARLNGISSVAVTTGLGRLFGFKNPFVRRLTFLLYKCTGHLTREVWFLNETDRTDFLERGLIRKAKTFVMPSEGVNTSKFVPRKRVQVSPITRFLFSGRLLREKGIIEYIKAAEILKKAQPRLRFEVLGFLDEKNPEAITQEELLFWHRSGVIKYLGSTEDVRPYLARVDCLVFPSYYREGVSRILLEAASMEIPIITSRNVGCQDVVREGFNGLLCRPRSVDDLVSTIHSFLQLDHEKRALFGKNGREFVKSRFETVAVIEAYHQKLRDLCAPPELKGTSRLDHTSTRSSVSSTSDILDDQPKFDKA